MANELEKRKGASLLEKMAVRRGLDPDELYETLTSTVFKGANRAQMMTLLMVADRYKLDVTTKEIFAFPDKSGGIVPVVSVDGWISLAHKHPAYDGEELRWAEKKVVPPGGKPCPEWCEIIVYRKDTSHPTVIREYLDEVYRKTVPWQTHTKRMLRHKTMIQGYRVAFGFSGIYDEDEAQNIVSGMDNSPQVSSNAKKARALLSKDGERKKDAEQSEDGQSKEGDGDEEYEELAIEEPAEVVLTDEDAEQEDRIDAADAEDDDAAEQEPTSTIEQAVEQAVEKLDAEPLATDKQRQALKAAKERSRWSNRQFMELLRSRYHVEKPAELTVSQAREMIAIILDSQAQDGKARASQQKMSV